MPTENVFTATSKVETLPGQGSCLVRSGGGNWVPVKAGEFIIRLTNAGNWALFECRTRDYLVNRHTACPCPRCPGHALGHYSPGLQEYQRIEPIYVDKSKDKVLQYATLILRKNFRVL